jgi:opacity protein-like surface antigen
MILPCRIHQPRNRADPLPLALLFAACLLASVTEAKGQYAAGPSVPFEITAGVDVGYDDNVLGSNATTNPSGQRSFFARENVVLSYNRPTERTELHLLAVGRFSQFFDVGTDNKDGNITLSLTHNLSTRLSVAAYLYAAYQTEPDFGGNVGLENVRSDHYFTSDILSVTYQWLPRFSTVTSYTFQRLKYVEASSSGATQDRFQNTLAERLLFSLTRRTSLIGEYRFEIADYDTAPRDSDTHYVLAGVDHNLTEHLSVYVLGGESFRSFKNDGDMVDPYVEGSVAYESSNHTLTWKTSYGVEEPTATAALVRTTIRTGLNLTYGLTSRINAIAGVYYHHDENEGPPGTTSVGTQDSYQISLGLKYTINKHFALGVHYEHSSVSALGAQSGYSRNRYFGGLTYIY